MMKSILSGGRGMFLLLPSLPLESNDNIKRNNLVNDMVERRKKSGKEMKVTMDEFWEELKETRKINNKIELIHDEILVAIGIIINPMLLK